MPAGLQLAANEIDNDGAVFIGNPRPDTVEIDDVEIRHVVTCCHLFEGIVEQTGVRTTDRSERCSVCGLARVEVGTPEAAGVCSGIDISCDPLSEAKFKDGR